MRNLKASRNALSGMTREGGVVNPRVLYGSGWILYFLLDILAV